jgi:TonB-linked SusC/RagA family outer membrane protein
MLIKLSANSLLLNLTHKSMKFFLLGGGLSRHRRLKILRIMKLTLSLLLISVFSFASEAYSQKARISLRTSESTIVEIFRQIEENNEIGFLFKNDQMDMNKRYTVEFENASIEEVLDKLLGNDYNYQFVGYNVVITQKKEEQGISQQKQGTVKGTVKNADGDAIPGATVIIKGTSKGTVTDFDGNYQLDGVEAGAILQFSFVGMTPQEIAYTGEPTLDITLQETTIGIGEVVAVGYGVQKKVNVTGAISSMEGTSIIEKPVSQLSTALQGMAAGVTITQSSGQPGLDAGTINIRGVGTLNDNDPLVLVDGMEYSINDVDPNDIKNISVLKDAAASAIYGVRAANGVILITTKRGENKEIKVNYNGYVGIQDPTQLPNFVGAQDYMKLVNQLYGSQIYTDTDIAAYDNPNRDKDKYPDVFWMDEILQGSGFQQQHSLAISGGSEKSKYRFSTNYLKQDGLVKKMNFDRLTVRMNSDVNFNDKLNFSADMSAKFSSRTEPQGTGGGAWFQFSQAFMANPTIPVKYSDGTWGIGRSDGNPVRLQEEGGKYAYDDNVATGNFKLSYEVLDGLKITGNAMVNYNTSFNSMYNKQLTYLDFFTGDETTIGTYELTKDSYKRLYSNLQALLNYDKQIGDHTINFLAGISRVEDNTDYLTGYRNGGSLADLDELAGGSPSSQTNDGYSYGYGLLSYFGRLGYNYKDKYMFEANLRRDGSSRFAEENRWGTFPSFSAGWRVTQEPFMDSFKNVLDELKLRASWGKLGNQEIGNYPYQSVMNLGYDYPFGGTLYSGARMTTASNRQISWETTEMTNFGIDGLLYGGKVNFSFEYYIKNTDDILLELPIPWTVGQNAPYQNAGAVQNKGWEFSLGYKGKLSPEFKYGVRLNLSDVKNKITDLKNADWENQDNDNRILAYHVGEPIAAFYGYICDGIFRSQSEIDAHATQPGDIAPGDLIYRDLNNDKVIDANDRTVIGSNIPRYTYGLNLDAAYKNFDFSVFFQGVAKVDVTTVQTNAAPDNTDGNFKPIHKDAWSTDNTDGTFPRLITGSQNYVSSSFWIKSGAYLRLKNVQIGYTIPKQVIQTIGLSKCRLYVGGQNLLTFSKLTDDGIDPENPQDSRYYPQVKIYTFGINVDF